MTLGVSLSDVGHHPRHTCKTEAKPQFCCSNSCQCKQNAAVREKSNAPHPWLISLFDENERKVSFVFVDRFIRPKRKLFSLQHHSTSALPRKSSKQFPSINLIRLTSLFLPCSLNSRGEADVEHIVLTAIYSRLWRRCRMRFGWGKELIGVSATRFSVNSSVWEGSRGHAECDYAACTRQGFAN